MVNHSTSLRQRFMGACRRTEQAEEEERLDVSDIVTQGLARHSLKACQHLAQAEEEDRLFWMFVGTWGLRNRGEEPCWRQLQRFAGERLSPAMQKVANPALMHHNT